jgi:hypothetical protein
MGVAPRDLIDHLLERYGHINASDIANFRTRMEAPMDPTQPIDIYFQNIDDCVQFATDGQVPFTPHQIVQTASHAISKSGMYNDTCKEWQRKPIAERTRVAFKPFFATEYNDLKEQHKINSNQNNFHGANSAIDLTTDIGSFAMAATTDREVMARLTHTNQQLVATNIQLSAQLQQATLELTQMKKQTNYSPQTPPISKPTGTNKGTQPPFDHATWRLTSDPVGYCWTHGYRVVRGHNSQNCSRKNKGHQDGATRTNNMGGSTKHKA